MHKIKFVKYDVFTKEPFLGNPAGVVFAFGELKEAAFQRIAYEINPISETAFLLKPTLEGADFRVRFFTATTEINFCGHASLASCFAFCNSHISKMNEGINHLNIETSRGVLRFEAEVKEGTLIKAFMYQREPVFYYNEFIREKIARMIGTPEKTLGFEDLPIQIVSTGLKDLLIPVRGVSVLQDLEPDFDAISEFSKKEGIDSFHIFAFENYENPFVVKVRNFSPALGIKEDPVTGSANGALGAYLSKHLAKGKDIKMLAKQGEFMGRKGEVEVETKSVDENPKIVKVGGFAIEIMQGEILMP